jgi:hypothetical protein
VSRLLWLMTMDKIALVVLFLGLAIWGVVFATFQVLVAYGSKILVSYALAQVIVERVAGRLSTNRVLLLILALLIYVLLRSIPVFGWLLSIVVTLIGAGAIAIAFRSGRSRPKTAVTAPEVPLEAAPAGELDAGPAVASPASADSDALPSNESAAQAIELTSMPETSQPIPSEGDAGATEETPLPATPDNSEVHDA